MPYSRTSKHKRWGQVPKHFVYNPLPAPFRNNPHAWAIHYVTLSEAVTTGTPAQGVPVTTGTPAQGVRVCTRTLDTVWQQT